MALFPGGELLGKPPRMVVPFRSLLALTIIGTVFVPTPKSSWLTVLIVPSSDARRLEIAVVSLEKPFTKSVV